MDDRQTLSRRAVFKVAGMLAGITVISAAGLGRPALAQQKLSKASVKYQDKPSGNKECDNCLQFIPGPSPTANGTCKVVEGEINPKGYCIAWAAKS